MTGQDLRFQETLDGFGQLLRGQFRREPNGMPTPLGRALERLAQVSGIKPVPVQPMPGEARAEFLERAAAIHKMRPRRVRTDHGPLPDGDAPLLAFDAAGTPRLLVPRGRGGFRLEDPAAEDPPHLLREEEWRGFDEAFAFHRCLPDGDLTYRAVLRFGLRDSLSDIGLLTVCGLVGAGLALLPPLAAAQIADIAVHTADVAFLLQLLLLLGLGLVAETGFFIIGALTTLRIQGRSALGLHAAMVDRLLRLPAPALRGTSTLILATQMETVEKFRRSLLMFMATAAMALMHGLAAAAVLLAQSVPAGVIAVGMMIVLTLLAILLGISQFRAIYEGERMDVVVLAFAYDLVRLVPVLRAARLEKRAFVQWGQNFLAFQSRLMRAARISNRLGAIEPLWEALVLAACFAVLAGSGAVGGVTAGTAIVFVLALNRLINAAKGLSHAVMGASKLMPMARLARPFLNHVLEPASVSQAAPQITGALQMSGVGFSYAGRTALQDIDLVIEAGSFVGIFGPSGAGKSTLLNLLLGLERPSSGRVMLDGHDMAGLDRRGVLRQIGTVMQASRLLPGTIYDNIRGITAITVDEAWDFAAQADVEAELRALPMALQTIVTETGAGLSLGQVQRILIARALAQRPRMLVLDEAMSALDTGTQQRILDTLGALGMTRILITHRPAALARADQVIVLDRGRIVDAGPGALVLGRQRQQEEAW
jgi:ABC-type bacteriocin/lantibiotic exporter with double-glycine peptidase domain